MFAEKKPLVSVIIPTFNMAKWLPNALDSVLAQTYSHWECIVIDDGSTDNTQEVVEHYSSKDRRIRGVHKESGGPSSARNAGIQISKGELIAFLDADDVWLPTKLTKQVELLSSVSSAGLCCTYFEEVDEQLNLLNQWPEIKARNKYSDDITPESLLENVSCCGVPGSASSAVVRRECFEKLGLFDTRLRMGEDLDMWYRISLDFSILQQREVLVMLRKSSKERDIQKVLNDLSFFVEKARQFAPQSHQKLLEKASYDSLWGGVVHCYQQHRFLLAIRLLLHVFLRNPSETAKRIGRKIPWPFNPHLS